MRLLTPSIYNVGLRTRVQPATNLVKLTPTNALLEEELVPDYNPNHFCQVTPGDSVGTGRYAVISKLGWGSTSTVWLARDLQRYPSKVVAAALTC